MVERQIILLHVWYAQKVNLKKVRGEPFDF